MTDEALFLALARIPPIVVARVSGRIPPHVDRDDLLQAANIALLLTIRRHREKSLEDIAKLSWKRCAGAVSDELRSMVLLRGARRRGVRATMISLDALHEETLSSTSHQELTVILGAVRRAFDALPPMYQRVVVGRMHEERNLDLAAELGVSPPRIVQIYAAAILRMQGSVFR